MQNTLKTRPLGKSGIDWSVITFGCWQAGGDSWSQTNDDDSLAAMRGALEGGITSFDTAEGYGKGHSEVLLGRFLREMNTEGVDIKVATKVGAEHLSADDVAKACENSLRNLGLETIDLYQIHWPAGTWGTPRIPIEETMGALLKLQQAGKIRAIGVSNFNAAQIEEAQQYGRIDSLQPPYSLFFQPYVQDGTVAFCEQHEIAVIPYSPLAQGLVTGKFNQQNRPTDNRAHNHLFKDPTYSAALAAVEALKPIAAQHDTTTARLALAWLMAKPGVTSPIVGARTPQQILDIIPASELTLDADTIKAIDDIAAPVLAVQPQGKSNPWGGG